MLRLDILPLIKAAPPLGWDEGPDQTLPSLTSPPSPPPWSPTPPAVAAAASDQPWAAGGESRLSWVAKGKRPSTVESTDDTLTFEDVGPREGGDRRVAICSAPLNETVGRQRAQRTEGT